MPLDSETPAWFRRAIVVPFTDHVAHEGETPIHYVRWGAGSKKTPVLLIHGGGAHAHWWGFLGPLLAERYDVLALDLSGHGDSGRRDRYPREVWAADVLAVLDHAQLSERPFLVGHSMGGFVSMVTASLHGDRLAGAVIVDAPVTPPRATDLPPPQAAEGTDAKPAPREGGWSFQRLLPYPDFEGAVTRFRLLPDQPVTHPFLVDYVARRSVRQDPDGFAWKFDPHVFARASQSSLRDYFTSARCRLALIRGAESTVLPQDVADYMRRLLPGRLPFVEIPDAHHHLMFDQPLALLVAVRALLADWECTRPIDA